MLRQAPGQSLLPPKTLILLAAGVATTVAIGILTQVGLSALSGVRAYVGGEGLWSKAQKDAVHWLHRYAQNRDEASYRAYRAAISVPLGDRMAREELEKPRPDFDVAARGFILGRNHPDDVGNMVRLFRDFGWVGYMRRAVAIWRQGDLEISRLVASGERLRTAVESGAEDDALTPILAEIDAVNARVSPLEDQFSFTLGEAARWTRRLSLQFVVTAAVLLFLLGAFAVRKLIHEIAASEERYRTVTETAADGIVSIDERGRILFANTAATLIFGHPEGHLIGMEFSDLLPERLRDRQVSLLREHLEGASHDGSSALRLQGRHREGGEIPLEVWFGQHRRGRRRIFTGIVRDITRRLQAEQEIERLAYHDPLTGLPNRALFLDRLNQAIARARRYEERIAVMFLDLDDFKLINDSLGHTAGDSVLKEVARRLAGCLRGQDTAARAGGDEFILFLPGAGDASAVARVSAKILEAIAVPIELDGQSLLLSSSVGISMFPDDGMDVETLLRSADISMYRAKEKGAGTFEFFTAEMNRRLSSRREIEQALFDALKREELTLHYSPIWRVDDERVAGVEALLRWNSSTRGQLPASEFISVAENSQVILPLGDWVLSRACGQLKRWREQGLPVERISVNVAARQFQQRNLQETIDRILRGYGLAPEHINIEITEAEALKNVDLSIATLGALRERGIRILMDDFGGGNACIGYLRRLPIDVVKIDPRFIEPIGSSSADTAIVRSLIEMAHALGLSVVAEGVSRREQLAILRDHGCDEFQGHLMSPPLPPDALAELIAARNG